MGATDPAFCKKAVDRLKLGPADIQSLSCSDKKYTDTSFEGSDQIWWSGYNAADDYATYDYYLGTGFY